MAERRIVVLGAGPAAAAVAIGLARMGEPVTVVGEPRRFAAVEGVSMRVIRALHGLGLEHALAAFAPPSPRRAIWSGVRAEANTESLVDRQRFDCGILDDLTRLGVAVVCGRVVSVNSAPGRHEIEADVDGERQLLTADFLVEARGRAAPGGGLPRVRGWRRCPCCSIGKARQAQRSRRFRAARTAGRGWLRMPMGVAICS